MNFDMLLLVARPGLLQPAPLIALGLALLVAAVVVYRKDRRRP